MATPTVSTSDCFMVELTIPSLDAVAELADVSPHATIFFSGRQSLAGYRRTHALSNAKPDGIPSFAVIRVTHGRESECAATHTTSPWPFFPSRHHV